MFSLYLYCITSADVRAKDKTVRQKSKSRPLGGYTLIIAHMFKNVKLDINLVDAVFTGISSILGENFFVLLDQIVTFFELSDVNREVIAGGAIHTQHLKRRRRTALFEKTVNLEAFRISVITKNLSQSRRIAVEISNNRLVRRKELLELARAKLTLGRANRFVRQS